MQASASSYTSFDDLGLFLWADSTEEKEFS